ncbi:MAG: DUF3604 domain-containing protein [Proteobacteria bacterium]|nr:DUF3604 domain-containing protein [Pseudomonadota bacterium]
MRHQRTRWSLVLCTALAAQWPSAHAGEGEVQSYSPYAGDSYPSNVYWGDMHVHTSYSSHDAYIGGWNRVDPAVAYRFARGEEVEAFNGMRVRLQRPLDFLVVADHAEGLGIADALQAGDPAFPDSPVGRKYREAWDEYVVKSTEEGAAFYSPIVGTLMQLFWAQPIDLPYRRTLWQRVIANADAYNNPGKFTAFIGYEWTSSTSVDGPETGLANLHRVVVFKDGADETAQTYPFSQADSDKPDDLWRHLVDYEDRTGGEALAIPHNSNLSQGLMFPEQKTAGEALDASWAGLRSHFETIMEITQIKGDSETHPVLSPTDEFADFETWNDWGGPPKPGFVPEDIEAFAARKRGSYARAALQTGLKLEAELGINPFKLGFIGSTDSHTALSTADEDNFWGKWAIGVPSAERVSTSAYGWSMSAAGLAAVWAQENTREALFDAMKRREVYATTGPRMTVRVFGGWDFADADAAAPDFARIGYAQGVPMGGDFVGGAETKSPRFLIRAMKDPDGANLDRVQVIKGWLDAEGVLHEKIHNVAWSGGRELKPDGSLDPVGSTVDVSAAAYWNTLGDAELATVWQDPDFDPAERAFYYVRVLQIPTPRWTAYEAAFFRVRDIPEEVPVITQDRAYTSPIWYTPGG